MWVGEFDFDTLEFTNDGVVYNFPRDNHCEVRLRVCNASCCSLPAISARTAAVLKCSVCISVLLRTHHTSCPAISLVNPSLWLFGAHLCSPLPITCLAQAIFAPHQPSLSLGMISTAIPPPCCHLCL